MTADIIAPLALCAAGSYPKGSVITGLEEASAVCGVNVYHAGTALNQVSEEGMFLVRAWYKDYTLCRLRTTPLLPST
jgi:hypothetical protein